MYMAVVTSANGNLCAVNVWINTYQRRPNSFTAYVVNCYWLVHAVFSTLPARSHHSPAFSIHLIIYIGHSSPTISSLHAVSSSQTALSDMLRLTCGASFLLLFVFLISLVHHHHPALNRRALVLDRLLTFLTAFSTLVLKLFFSRGGGLFTHSHLYYSIILAQIDLWKFDHSVFVSHWRR